MGKGGSWLLYWQKLYCFSHFLNFPRGSFVNFWHRCIYKIFRCCFLTTKFQKQVLRSSLSADKKFPHLPLLNLRLAHTKVGIFNRTCNFRIKKFQSRFHRTKNCSVITPSVFLAVIVFATPPLHTCFCFHKWFFLGSESWVWKIYCFVPDLDYDPKCAWFSLIYTWRQLLSTTLTHAGNSSNFPLKLQLYSPEKDPVWNPILKILWMKTEVYANSVTCTPCRVKNLCAMKLGWCQFIGAFTDNLRRSVFT